jgi:hypothetical protein
LPQSWNKRQFQQLLLAVNQHAPVRGLPEPALVADKAGFVLLRNLPAHCERGRARRPGGLSHDQ